MSDTKSALEEFEEEVHRRVNATPLGSRDPLELINEIGMEVAKEWIQTQPKKLAQVVKEMDAKD